MFVREFPTACSIEIRTGERAGSGVLQLRSEGFLTFAIGTRFRSAVVDLRLVDAEARFEPFSITVDGTSIEIDGFVLTTTAFDLPACRGEVDQETNEGWFRLVLTVTLEHLPALRGVLDLEEARIELVERGRIDIARGRILETRADAFEIPRGIPREVIARAGSGETRNRKYAAPACDVHRVELGAVLTDELTPTDANSTEWEQGELIVCPDTRITVVWRLEDVAAVRSAEIHENRSDTSQPLGVLDPAGIGTVDVAPHTDAEYELRVLDPDCAPRSNKVRVWVVTPGKEITLALLLDPAYNAISATFRGNPKFIGEDVYVTSVRAVNCAQPGILPPMFHIGIIGSPTSTVAYRLARWGLCMRHYLVVTCASAVASGYSLPRQRS